MRIASYRVSQTSFTWGRPVGDVNGIVESGVTGVAVLEVLADDGTIGTAVGEVLNPDNVFAAIHGADPLANAALYDAMLGTAFKPGAVGTTFATIGAFDTALWDLKAKALGVPLWKLLGGRDRAVPGYASGLDFGLNDDELTTLYQAFAAKGFTAGKLKGGASVADDVRRLGLVAEQLGANTNRPGLMLDANESWHQSQAVRHVGAIEDSLDLVWIEEPVGRHDAAGLAHVAGNVRAGVATGENLTGPAQHVPLLRSGAVSIVQAGGVWGVSYFLRLAALAHAFHLPVSGVGYYTNPLAAASTAIPNVLPLEVQHVDHPAGVTVDQYIDDGSIVLGDEPGSGVRFDPTAAVLPTAAGFGGAGGPHVLPSRVRSAVLSVSGDRTTKPHEESK